VLGRYEFAVVYIDLTHALMRLWSGCTAIQ
jgi:hypothetical protein